MTLKEYLLDYGSDFSKDLGQKLIDQELEKIPNEVVKAKAKKYIEEMETVGKRDFRF